nr:DJ-1 family protein [Anaerolineae bacterium]
MKKIVLLFLAALMALVACGPRPTPTAAPIEEPLVEQPTDTPPPSPTSAEAPTPAEAPAPTETPAPVPTMQVLLIIAPENFRDEEYAEPRAAFEAAGYAVVVASSSLEVATGMLGMEVQPDLLLADVQVEDYDAVVFVGGVGAAGYWDDPQAHRIAQEAVAAEKVVGAICIAPVILARAGVLEGKQATVFQGNCGELEVGGAICDSGVPVQRDGLIITANGPPVATAFGEAILDALTEQS